MKYNIAKIGFRYFEWDVTIKGTKYHGAARSNAQAKKKIEWTCKIAAIVSDIER